MAEYCLDCFNKYFSETKVREKDVITDYDLCEGCGEWKPCVIKFQEKDSFKAVKNFIKRFSNLIIRQSEIYITKKEF